MRSDAGVSRSIWHSGVESAAAAGLTEDAEADVCVVGAGIAGLSVAYRAALEGLSVVLLDHGDVGGGETGRSTAHLVTALDDRYYRLEYLHGARGAAMAAESAARAIDFVEETVERGRIRCGFARVDGFLVVPEDGRGRARELLRRELDAAHRAGVPVEWVDRVPTEGDWGPGLRFAHQAQFHPLRYLAGLLGLAQRLGVRVFTRTRAHALEAGAVKTGADGGGPRVRARAIVVATNTPFNERVALHAKQSAHQSYWDDGTPYHYVRTLQRGPGSPDEAPTDLLIVGGEDHRTGQDGESAEARYGRLEEWTRRHFSSAGAAVYRWSGEVMEPHDRIAFIGRHAGDGAGVFVVTGDSGTGITHGTIAGLLIPDLILGRSNPWAELYAPARRSLRALPTLLRENLNTAVQYADWLSGAEITSEGALAPGEGGVLVRGLHRIAVYRDSSGLCHRRNAACPHLGGVVRWNPAEKTWDCPCHGSRFDRFGTMVHGPASRDLGRVPAPEELEPTGNAGPVLGGAP